MLITDDGCELLTAAIPLGGAHGLLDLVERAGLPGLDAALGVGDRVGDVQDELSVGACLVWGLCGEDRGCRAQGFERLRLDLLRRSGEAEPTRSAGGELADELASALLTLLAEVLRERADLAEGVGEVAVADRDEHSGPRHALLHRLPLVLGEIRLACHLAPFPSSRAEYRSRTPRVE